MNIKLASILINLGVKLLPEKYRTSTVICNMMKTNMIKVKVDN